MYSSIEAIDFGCLYLVQRKASTHKAKGKDAWNKKAKDMNNKIHSGVYNDTIIEKVNLEEVEDVLDVGCGPGTFSLKFAPFVKKVYAFDFSTNMLEALKINAKELKLNNIEAMQKDIEGDWEDIPTCDVVLASRCMEVDDIKAALIKLDKHAKKAVYLTFKVGKSYLSEELLNAMKREIIPKPDYIYLVNVLYQLGIQAKVEFILPADNSCVKATSLDEYIDSVSWSLDGISKEEEKLIEAFYQKCIDEKRTPPLRDNRWALISWTK